MTYGAPGKLGLVASREATKTGEACISNFFGLIALGDASIDTAKKAGKIQQVAYYETEFVRATGYYSRLCTHVYGK